MTKFKASEVKLVGKVKVSAKRLMELGEQLKKVRGTDGNEEIDVYMVPGKEASEAGQLAFDFVPKQPEQKPELKEEKKVEAQLPEQKAQPKDENQQPKAEEKPSEVKPLEEHSGQPRDEKNQAPNPAEQKADQNVSEDQLTKDAKEVTQKAYPENQT